MGELRTWAIGIGELRGMFSADEKLAARLRAVASDRFRVPAAESRPVGLLGRLGLGRGAGRVELPPEVPTTDDVERLLASRFVTPDRVPQSWAVLRAWLDELSWGSLVLELPERRLDDLEFDLARAGLPSEFSPRHLPARDTQLVLRPEPGMQFGYARQGHVVETADAMAASLAGVDPRSRADAEALAHHLAQYRDWSRAAEQAGRPAPDLFAIVTH